MSIVRLIEDHVESLFENEGTGHDWYHIDRVRRNALHIQEKEGGDREIVEIAALLHDISDYKFNGGDDEKGGVVTREILKSHNYPADRIQLVVDIVNNVSFKGANTETNHMSLEGQIVQDADRLDAIGAIGIARTFAYGGNVEQPIYDPKIDPSLHQTFEEYANSRTSTINHFYEKLLLLKDRMNTKTGIELASERHQVMETFLRSFYEEWNFNTVT